MAETHEPAIDLLSDKTSLHCRNCGHNSYAKSTNFVYEIDNDLTVESEKIIQT
jgi:hypothetical protein